MALVTLTQSAFTAGELSPRVLGRTDMDRYAYGLKRCRNAYPVIHGGVVRRPGSEYLRASVTADARASILVPFVQGDDLSWMVEFSNGSARVISPSNAVVATLTAPYTAAQLAELDWAQSDSTMWLFHPQVPVQRLQRLGSGSWVLSPAPFTQQPFAEAGLRPAVAATLSDATVGAGRTLTAAGSTFLASDVGRGVIFDSGLAVITAYTSGTVVTVEITRAFPSTALTANNWTIDISPQAECTPSADGPVGETITLTLGADGWRASDVGGIVRINGGLCRITTYTSATVVSARVLRELTATVGAPALAWSLEPVIWSSVFGYPRSGTIYQQRLIVAGSASFPRTVWGSRIGEPLDFERWTNDDDSFAFTIDSDETTPIRYISSGQELAVFTESAEYSMRGGVEKPITPTNVRVRPESNHGTAQVRPVQVNRETLFVQRAGRKVRAFGYRYDFDGFSSPDIVALAEHITASGVVAMAYAQEPDLILWAVRADGVLLSCTVDRDQQPSVLAWAQHTTDGFVEGVAAIPIGDRDQVWMIVRRTIGEASVRYIERLNDTFEPWHPSYTGPDGVDRPVYGFTVDSGVVFDNNPGVTSVSAPHLAGKLVELVADGSRLNPVTVAEDGAIPLERACKRLLVGLPFIPVVTLLTPEVQTGAGSAQGKPARTGELFIRVLNTIGARIQNSQGNYEEIAARQFGPAILDQPPLPFTGLHQVKLLGWERGESEITITQQVPMPMHVLAAIRTHSVGGI